MTVVECAYIGGLVGLVKRRNRGTPTVIVVGACAGVAFGAVTVGALKVLARLRNLIFESITANVNGVARALSHVPYMQPVSERMKDGFPKVLTYWPWLIGGSSALGILIVTLIGWWALSRVLTRLFEALQPPEAGVADPTPDVIAPLPVRLHDVTFRYPNADHDALGPVTLERGAG